ncbi:efflux RND transporter periplasmic adaptor subunit [Hyphobacterium sp. HN65]|uniref:Efflux RND transporter periplasmic adaptor subunit n=1 Tax=Hyphobacterium lacteum TaxID=3116575 RepID=A0ABU7LNF9_9PROT|nr:efflux RND transporter periplasmic adaptor subunit [Hyphobacterium sp. HN65]MEE2525455.1 efflux RND transporter periplasmic adaptor subunit [Hyphobacterium sp. HN65]
MGRIILSVLIFLGVGAIFFVIYGALIASAPEPERANAQPRPVAVFASAVENTDVTLRVNTQGEVRPVTQISLVPQVSGRIVYVNPNFIEGGFFEAGETLIQIDDADYRLAVTRAQAQVAQAQQALVREQAESDLAAAEWAELGEGQASSLTLREPQLAQARASLAAAQAQLQEARLGLERTRISAPFAGRVRTKSADLGQFVAPGTPLGEVFATDAVQVRLPLTDNELSMLNIPVAFQANSDQPGPRVRITATLAGQYREWEAELVRTDSAIDTQTRVLYGIARIDDPYGETAERVGAPLPVGLFVDAEIEGRVVADAYILPRSALRGANTVYVAEEGGLLSIRNVSVITSSPERLVVADGVTIDDMVVTSPVRAASDGMRIRTFDQSGEIVESRSTTLPTGDDDDDEDSAEAEAGNDEAQLVSSVD